MQQETSSALTTEAQRAAATAASPTRRVLEMPKFQHPPRLRPPILTPPPLLFRRQLLLTLDAARLTSLEPRCKSSLQPLPCLDPRPPAREKAIVFAAVAVAEGDLDGHPSRRHRRQTHSSLVPHVLLAGLPPPQRRRLPQRLLSVKPCSSRHGQTRWRQGQPRHAWLSSLHSHRR